MSKEIIEDLKEIVLEKEKYLDSIEPDKFFQRRKLIKEITVMTNAYNIIELQQQEIKELRKKQIDIKDFETYKKIAKATEGVLILNPKNELAYKLFYNPDFIISLVESDIRAKERGIEWENWLKTNPKKFPLELIAQLQKDLQENKQSRIK